MLWISLCFLLYPVLSTCCDKRKEVIVQRDDIVEETRKNFTKIQKQYVYAFYPVAKKFCPRNPKLITRMVIEFIGVCLPDDRMLRNESFRTDKSFGEKNRRVCGCRLSPDDQWVIGWRADNVLILWHVETGQSKSLGRVQLNPEKTIVFTSDSHQIIFASDHRTVKIVTVTTGTLVHSLIHWSKTHYYFSRGPLNISLSTDDQLILSTGYYDPVMQLWNRESGLCIREFFKTFWNSKGITWGQFCNKNQHIVCTYSGPWGSEGTPFIRVWSVRGKLVRKLHHHTNVMNMCQVSTDQTHLVSASEDKTVCVLQLSNGTKRQTYRGHVVAVKSCCFLLKDTHVVSMDRAHCLHIWRVADGSTIHSFHHYHYEYVPLTRSYWISSKNIECIIVGAFDRKSTLLDIESGNEVCQISEVYRNSKKWIEDVSLDGRFMTTNYYTDYGDTKSIELCDVQLIK